MGVRWPARRGEIVAAGAEVNDLSAIVTWANIPIANVPTGATSSTVSLGDHLHDGILDANLLDKAAVETVAGTWTFSATLVLGQNSGQKLILRDTNSTGAAALNFIEFQDMNEVRHGIIGFGSSGSTLLRIDNLIGDIKLVAANTDVSGALTAVSYGGITEANLLDKTAAETVSSLWTFTSDSGLHLSGQFPALRFIETDAPTDEGKWRIIAEGGNLQFRTFDDADSANTTWLNVSRTGITVNTLAFIGAITATSFGGITEANLLDKSAPETISAAWNFADVNVRELRITTNTAFVASDGAKFYKQANNGASIQGVTGSSNDLTLQTPAGQLILKNPTGTSDAVFVATVTASNFKRGTGSPESVVTGIIGDLFTRTDGGSSTTLYVKESGTGNTGWVAK